MEKVYNAHRVISEALDREDAAAQDLNKWINDNKEWLTAPVGTKIGNNFGAGLAGKIFFKNIEFRIYQVANFCDLKGKFFVNFLPS